MGIVIIWLLFGFIAGIIGSKKGEGCLGFIVGVLLGPFGILFAIFSKGNQVTCPYCKELIKKDAIVCKHCGQSLTVKTQAYKKNPVDPVDEWERKQKLQQTARRTAPPAAPATAPCPHCNTPIDLTGLKPGKYTCPNCKGHIEIE